jgi:GNAT superfamily N-acetyltransferase
MTDGGCLAATAGQPVGMALMNGSALVALVVHPDHRRRGVGAALLEATRPEAVGQGERAWMWPGLPDNLVEARPFFSQHGWRPTERVWDFVADLRSFRPLAPPQATPGLSYRVAAPSDMAAVTAFERRHFPFWSVHYEAADADSVVVAVDRRDGAVVGTLRIEWPARHGPGRWSRLLGDDLGAIRAVGIDRRFRGRGVGTALVVAASEHLRKLGVGVCLVDWLVRTGFYRRAGYEPWRSYQLVKPAGPPR